MKYASERRSAGGQISRYGSRDYGGIMKYREQFFYIGKKIVVFLCSLLVLSVLVFTISRLTPTDPLKSYYGERVEKMSVEEKEATREKLGLNDPVPTQYFRWVQNALQGDLVFPTNTGSRSRR